MENQNQNQKQDCQFHELFSDNTQNNSDSLRFILLDMQKKISSALELLDDRRNHTIISLENRVEDKLGVKVIEGVFNGQHMIGQDGKQYLVPQNYASKSKLVEGDLLKLTVTASGAFIYKQVVPMNRVRLTGVLARNDEGDYTVQKDSEQWNVLPASITFFKGEPGDAAVILVPQNAPSKWAAVENIIKKT